MNRKDDSIVSSLNSKYKLLSESKSPITLTVMLKMKLEPRHITLVDADESSLDGKTGLLTGLLAGKQVWKNPVALLATC